jgi:hypothetical protein
MQPVRGYHVSRFAWAESHGLISAAEFAAVTGAAGSFTPAAVIYDTIQGGAISADRRVLGPFETAAEALSALRPADRSFVAPESRLGLLTETLRAAGVELAQWDREVACWLADLDVQTIAPVLGWVSRAGRDPAPDLIVQALADALAYQTALTSGCPDCAQAAPEGCADHREDAARAAEYERALRSLVTWREAQLWTLARSVGARCRLALGGAAHQLLIPATEDLRDVAVSCTCLRAVGLDPTGVRRRWGRRRGVGGMAGPPSAERSGDMTALADAVGRVPDRDRGPGEWYDVGPHGTEACARRERRHGRKPYDLCLPAGYRVHAYRAALRRRPS